MELSNSELKKFEEKLRNLATELRSVSDQIVEGAKTVELDQNRVGRISRMDAMQAQALAKAGVARNRSRLQDVEQALARIVAGEFGYCLDCDEAIPVARLRIDPTNCFCIRCAEKRE